MKNFIFIIFLLFNLSANAQNAQDIIDGLKKDLKANPDDKKRATIYSDLTWYYSNISLDSAMTYGKKAIIESIKLKDSTLIAQVYSDLGAVYFKKGDYNISEKNYLAAYKIRKIKNDGAGLAKINANLANVYQTQERYVPAMKANLESLNYFKSIDNAKNVNIIKGNVANLLFKMRDYKKALVYINEAINYQLENNAKNDLCKTYVTKGNILLNMNDTINSQKSYNYALKYCNEVGDKFALSSAYNNLSIIKAAQNKQIEADKFYENAKSERKILNSDINNAKLEFNFIDKLIKEKKFKQAKSILFELKQVFIAKNSTINILNVYQKLIPVCLNLNENDSVIYYSNNYINLFEELLKKNAIKQTAELETKYQTAKKEKQIITQQAAAKQKNIYLLGLGILTILIGAIGFLIYRQQRQKNQQIVQENELKSAIAVIENQNKLQEQRLSISRDLHDNIGSQLTFIISSVENVKYGFNITNEKLDNKLTNISSFAKDTILELRDTIWAMNSNEISYEDLEIRINNFIEKAKLSQENISFSFAIDENLKYKKLTSVEGMNIYRTIQEAINNALKYAQAKIISVNIKQKDNHTVINIKDNGNGFNLETIEKGNGLNNMKKRIDEIGGKFDLTSSSDGTKIEILINS